MAQLMQPSSLLQGQWYRQQFVLARYRLRLLPWPVALGAALLLCSLLALLLVIMPQRYAIEKIKHDLLELRRHMPLHLDQPVVPIQSSLASFYDALPPEPELPALMGRIWNAASENGLSAEKVEYQFIRNTSAAFGSYQITLPVHGDYVAVRKFTIDVLNTLPNAALSEIAFTRDEASPDLVQARIRLTLYMKSQ